MTDQANLPATSTVPETQPEKSAVTTTDDQSPAWLPGRLDRARSEAREKLLKELGIEDIDADKVLLANAKQRRADEQSEIEKAAAKAEREQKRADQLQADFNAFKQQVETQQRDAKRTDAVRAALNAAHAKADKVLALVQVQHANLLDAVLKDDGTVNDQAVTALVEAARKAYPEDFRTTPGSPSNAGGRVLPSGKADQDRARRANQNLIRG